MVERTAHNGFVVGSNPTGPILKFYTVLFNMDFNLKTYQIIKLKKYFKNQSFFLLFHAAKLNETKWTIVKQDLKKLKLKYYKPLNKSTAKTLRYSVYKNFSSNVTGFVLFINSSYKTTRLNLQAIVKSLKPSFVLTSMKLNNKIYPLSQLKGLNELSYKKSVFNLHKKLDKLLKTSYVLTNKKVSK